jgi:hypothetical protein
LNAIQQISLKLQMGIDPAADINPVMLRSMWQQLLAAKAGIRRKRNSVQSRQQENHDSPGSIRRD